MEGQILFKIELEYVTTQFPELISRAVSKSYNTQTKLYEWVFKMEDLERVIGILGKPITFEGQKENINKLIGLCPPLKESIEMAKWKGRGEYTFMEQPDIFLIGEWQKDPITGKPKQAWINIPKENVLINWGIIKDYPFNKWIKIKTQAEHVCRSMGFDAMFRDSGTFDWSKFIGLHRKGHLPYVYYPVKILAHLGIIEYSKVGKLRRIKENIEFQYQFSKSEKGVKYIL